MSSELKLFLLLTKFQDPTHTPNCDRPHVSAIYRHIFSGVCKSSNSEKIPKVRANNLKKLEDTLVNQTLTCCKFSGMDLNLESQCG